jgi:hypothetical protein
MNRIGHLLHISEDKNTIIEEYGIDNLISSKHNGIISNLYKHFIDTNNEEQLVYLNTQIELNNIKLMKRDYLNLSKYYYYTDIVLSEKYFDKIINFENKDIDFLIENQMIYMLVKLENRFLTTTIIKNEVLNCETYNFLDKYYINVDKIKLFLEPYINKYLYIDFFEYDYIIDAGNVIYSRNNYHDLFDVVEYFNKKGKTLVIIHSKHKNKINLKNLKASYFITPPKMYDDIFIMWFFIKQNCQCYIISNDKYKDHIYNYKQNKCYDNDFEYILQQQIINYNIKTFEFTYPKTYSKCIQIKNNQIYIFNPIIDTFISLMIS